jgi:hypothetical protein
MAQSRGHHRPEGNTLSISTQQQTFPAQRGKLINTDVRHHDHAWRRVDDPEQPLLLGMYRCDLCKVVWAL